MRTEPWWVCGCGELIGRTKHPKPPDFWEKHLLTHGSDKCRHTGNGIQQIEQGEAARRWKAQQKAKG